MRVGRLTASALGLACLLAVFEGSGSRVAQARAMAAAGEPTPTPPSCPVISIFGPFSFFNVFAGTYFYQSFSASGGAFPTTMSLTGTPPPGTSLTPAGNLLGTLTTAGSFSFTIVATDANGCTGTRDFTVPVAPGMTPGTLPNTLVSTPYSQTLTGIGGAPYSFFVFSGGPPSGLSLSAAGVLSGTTGAGAVTNSFTAKATATAAFGNRYNISVQTSTACTLEVTTTADAAPPAAPVAGSLRAAISCANRHLNAPGTPDTISFNIPSGTDAGCNLATQVCVIAPLSSLIEIVDPVIVDGYSQPGATPNTLAIGDDAALKIVLNGANAGLGQTGLSFGANAGGSRVRGLAINGFGTAIVVAGGTGTTIDGNFIGTDVTGSVAGVNTSFLLSIADAVNTTIGGGVPAARNVIAGGSTGIVITGGGINGAATGNVIKGNYIGMDHTGTVVLGNNGTGITITHANNTQIGGTGAGDGNLITGNTNGGIRVQGESNGTVIQGNRIGKSYVNGIPGPGNGFGGSISIVNDSSYSLVGGTQPGAGNIIHSPGSNGVRVTSGVGNTVSGNMLIGNTLLSNSSEVPILLSATDTITVFQRLANDPCDADTGGNLLQNFPILTSVSSVGGTTTIQGSLNSAPGTDFTLEFYTNLTGDSLQVFDSTVVTTNGGCIADFSFQSSAPVGQIVAVTATDPNGNTSELSKPGLVNADFSILKQISPNPVATGSNVTVSLQAAYVGPLTSKDVMITDALPAALSFVSIDAPSGWNCTMPAPGSWGDFGCTKATMSPGETASFTIVASVRCAVTDNTTIGGSAIISSETTDADFSNNSSTASTVATNALPTITAPAPLTLPNDLGQCTRTIPTLQFGTPTASDTCSTPTVTVSGVPAGNVFPVGTTTITWKATDNAGAFKTATQAITVQDTEAPRLSIDPAVAGFSGPGSGNGQLAGAYGAAIDGAGNVYVADAGNNRIQKFRPDGTFVAKWGTLGSGNGQFSSPGGVAVDKSGNVYVADTLNNRVQKFTSAGVFVTAWGAFGSGNGQFNTPYGIAVDVADNVYVADTYNHRIQKFSAGGVFIAAWGSEGSSNGQFEYPLAVAVFDGFVFVADTNNDRVQRFTMAGAYELQWGGSGLAHGQFNRPYGIVVGGPQDSVFVADGYNDRIERFSWNGEFLDSLGSAGTGAGQFNFPIGVAWDRDNLFVVDWGNNRVHRFTGETTSLTPGSAPFAGSFTDNCEEPHVAFAQLRDLSKTPAQYLSANLAVDENVDRVTGAVSVPLPGVSTSFVQLCDSSNCANLTVNAAGQVMSHVAYALSQPTVKGTGQINSPVGALIDHTDSGPAAFTFKAWIPKGSQTATGTLDFAFPIANPVIAVSNPVDLRWLVVAGARGQFKAGATCTYFGAPTPCQLVVTVVDGDQPNGGGLDRFRIKISIRGGFVLYDSRGDLAPDFYSPAPVSSDPSTSIDFAKFDSTTTLTSTHNPSLPGQSITLTATVTSIGGTPPGSVTFKEGPRLLATVALNASGVATFTTNALATGVHAITADYAGDGTFGKSRAAIDQAVQVPSVTTLASSINPIIPGQATQLTGAVTGSAGKAKGTVNILDNGVLFDVANLNPTGQFSIKYSTLVAGVHTLTAQYPGDGSYGPSTSAPVSETVQLLPSTTTLTMTPSPSLLDVSVKFTITVDGVGPTPTGAAALLVDGTQIAIDALDNKGKVTYSTTLLTMGFHAIRAEYYGDGAYAGSVGLAGHTVNIFVTKWGTFGSADGQFSVTYGIATDPAGNVYVTDRVNKRVQKFNKDGRFLLAWGSSGNGPGQFTAPEGIATDPAGNVYVLDQAADRVQKFTSRGVFLTQWGAHGQGVGQFSQAEALTVDPAGNVYVSDTANGRIQEFTGAGVFIRTWDVPNFGGVGIGTRAYTSGVAADPFGYIYVADSSNNRILKFTNSGALVTTWGSLGSGDGQFRTPYGLATDGAGNVLVADTNNDRIQVFSGAGAFLAKWGSAGAANGFFEVPIALATSDGFVYVLDKNNYRVQKFVSPP